MDNGAKINTSMVKACYCWILAIFKLQNDSESPQKRRTKSVQLKTRWHLLVIGWLTAASLLLSSQLDAQLPLKTWLTLGQLYWKRQLVPTVVISVFSVEFHWECVCVNLCPTPPSAGALWAFLLQTASKLIHRRVAAAEKTSLLKKKKFPFIVVVHVLCHRREQGRHKNTKYRV